MASSLLSKSSECWGEHGFTNHPFRNWDKNWQVGRAMVSGVKITLKCEARRGGRVSESERWTLRVSLCTAFTWEIKLVGLFWSKVNTFVISKMKIFDFNLNTEWPEVLPNKDGKGLYCVGPRELWGSFWANLIQLKWLKMRGKKAVQGSEPGWNSKSGFDLPHKTRDCFL